MEEQSESLDDSADSNKLVIDDSQDGQVTQNADVGDKNSLHGDSSVVLSDKSVPKFQQNTSAEEALAALESSLEHFHSQAQDKQLDSNANADKQPDSKANAPKQRRKSQGYESDFFATEGAEGANVSTRKIDGSVTSSSSNSKPADTSPCGSLTKQLHDQAEDKQPNSKTKVSNRNPEKQSYISDFFVNQKSEVENVPTCSASGRSVGLPSSSMSTHTTQSGSLAEHGSRKLETGTSQSQPANTVTEKQLVLDTEKITQDWSSVGVHRCPVCNFSTDDEKLLKNHTTTCTLPKLADGKGEVKITFSDGVFKCENCNLTWKNRAEFEEHLVCHIVFEPYVCLTCKKNFVSRYLIEKHAKTEHLNGDSKCGIKGIKKTRKLLGDLEKTKVLTVSGKLSVPQTPRNLVKPIPVSTLATAPLAVSTATTLATTPLAVSTVTTCASATSKNTSPAMVSSDFLQTPSLETASPKAVSSSLLRPENGKNIGVSDSPNDVGQTSFEEVSKPRQTGTAPNMNKTYCNILPKLNVSESGQHATCAMVSTSSSVVAKSISRNSSETQSVSITASLESPLFGVLNTETSTLTPASIPSKIQKVINDTSVLPANIPGIGGKISVQKELGKDIQIKPAKHHVVHFTSSLSQATPTATYSTVQTNMFVQNQPYQVKHFTEFTAASSVTPTDASVTSQPLYLIPVGPVIQPFHTQNVIFTDPQGLATANPQIPQGQLIQQSLGTPSQMTHAGSVPVSPVQDQRMQSQIMSKEAVKQPSVGQTNMQSLLAKGLQAVPQRPLQMRDLKQSENVMQSQTVQSPMLIINQRPSSIHTKGLSMNQTSHQTVTSPPTNGKVGFAPTNKTVSDSGVKLTKYENSASAVVSIDVHELGKPSTSSSAANDSSKQNHILERFQYKKLLFRIKPKHGFVCEGCRKFTRDEFVFRKHAWDHCHEQPMACKVCTKEQIASKEILSCGLVNDIVCSLIKNSALNLQKAKQTNPGQNDIIDISDDENEPISGDKSDEAVICLDDDQKIGIKISSTFSLTDMDDLVENIIKDQIHSVDVMPKKVEESEITQKKDVSQLTSKEAIQKTADNQNSGHMNQSKVPVGLRSQNSKDRRNGLENNSLGRKVTGTEDGNNRIDDTKPNDMWVPIHKENIVGTAQKIPPTFLHNSGLNNDDIRYSKVYSEEGKSNKIEISGKHYGGENNSSAAKMQSVSSGKRSKETNITETAVQKEPVDGIYKDYMKCTNSKSDSNKNSSASADDAARNLFESEVLATQSYNAFYMCGYETCSFSCLSSQRYKEHLQAKHLDEYNYVCCHCGLKDYSEETHVRHLFSHATTKKCLLYTCPVRLCKFGTNLLHMYEKHLKDHKEEDMNIKCVYCHQMFPTIDSLLLHLKQNLLKFFSCPHCSFRFTQRNVVTKHMQLCHPDKPRTVTVTSQVVCLEREFNFFVTPLVKRQAQDNPNEGGGSSTAIDIPRILDEVQNNSGSLAEKEIEGEIKTSQSSSTEQSKTSAPKKREQRKDSKKHEPVKKDKSIPVASESQKSIPVVSESPKKVLTPAGPMSLQCPHCSYLSHNQTFHAQHVSLHEGEPEREKRYVCNFCPKGFDVLPHFKRHMLNHIGRNEIKIFHCTSCPYSSNQKCHIMDHGQENHGGKGTYIMKVDVVISTETSCKYCDFKARQAEHVVQHEGLVHCVGNGNQPKQNSPEPSSHEKQPNTKPDDGENSKKKKKYHCDYCNGRFKHKHDLKKHLETEHTDIENKQFISYKCMYCNSYSSSMKNIIVEHINKKHEGEKEKKILRKIEIVKSKGNGSSEENAKVNPERDVHTPANTEEPGTDASSKQRVQIPPGNIFKVPFKCPLCSFSNTLRLNVIRHIKTHAELIPEMISSKNGKEEISKKTARKSTGQKKIFPTPVINRPKNSLVQDLPESSKLVNPFASLKERATEMNKDGNTTKDPYILGEYKLHKSLSACFISMENDVKFKCRICQQKIAKKFVLHRHILNHLGVDFFKCGYCDEGSIEKTLMFGHIQKEHMHKPIRFNELNAFELESALKEKIFSQNFVDVIENSSGRMSEKESNVSELHGSAKKTASVNTDLRTNDKISDSAPDELERQNEHKVLKCPLCKYVAFRQHHLKGHIESHSDPDKKYACSVCGYRGVKVQCIKHIYSKHGKKNAKVLEDGEPVSKSESHNKVSKEECETNKRNRKHSGNSATSSKEESAVLTDKTDSPAKKRNGESTKDKSRGLYEMKTILKCKDCGLKRESVSSMYKHFKMSSCKRPFYQCSLCSFQSPFKNAITKHAKLRHEGKKIQICDVSLRAKIKTMKIPVKQDSAYINEITPDGKREASPGISTSTMCTDEEEKRSATSEQGNLLCQLCKSQSFESMLRLQAHINSMHGGKMLYCQVCVYKTPIIKHMINHCTNLHRQKVAKYELEPKTNTTKIPGDEKVDDPKRSRTSSESAFSGEDKDESKRFVFQCPECSYESNNTASITRHMYTHFGYRPFVCKYCNVAVASLSNIKRHITNVHENRSIRYTLKKNVSVERKVKKMLDDLRNEKGKENRVHSCDMCDYRSSNKSEFDKHMGEKHPQVNIKKRPWFQSSESDSSSPLKKKQKLPIIESTSSGQDSDEEDMLSIPQKYQVSLDSEGGRQFSCGQCEYKTGKKKHLRRHLVTHGSSLYRCYYCNFTIKMCTKAYAHVEMMHPGERVQIWNKKTNEVMVKREATSTVSSPSSSISGTTGSGGKNHSQKNNSPQILMYFCSQCTWKNKGLYKFREHLACHPEFICRSENVVVDSKLACGYCSHVSQNENEFSKHIQCHLLERPFQCAYCSYSVFEKTKILYHTRQLHPKEEAIVIDRTKRRKHSLNVTLVDFDPKLVLKRVKMNGRTTKILKKIADSDDDVAPIKKKGRSLFESTEDSDNEIAPLRKKLKGVFESDDESEDVGIAQSHAGSSSNEVVELMECSVVMKPVEESLDNVKKTVEQNSSIANFTVACKSSTYCNSLGDPDFEDHGKKNVSEISDLGHEDVGKLKKREKELEDSDSVCDQADKDVQSLNTLQPKGEILYVATKVDKVVERDANSVSSNMFEGFSQQFSSESQGFEVNYPESQSFDLDEGVSEELDSSIIDASEIPNISEQLPNISDQLPIENDINGSLEMHSRTEDSELCGVAEHCQKNDGTPDELDQFYSSEKACSDFSKQIAREGESRLKDSSTLSVTEIGSNNEHIDKGACKSVENKTEASPIDINAVSDNAIQTNLLKDGGIELDHETYQSEKSLKNKNELTKVNEKSHCFGTDEAMNSSDSGGSSDITERRNIFDEFENKSSVEMDNSKNDEHKNKQPLDDEGSTENSRHGNVFEKFAGDNVDMMNSLAQKDECDEVKDNIFDKFNGEEKDLNMSTQQSLRTEQSFSNVTEKMVDRKSERVFEKSSSHSSSLNHGNVLECNSGDRAKDNIFEKMSSHHAEIVSAEINPAGAAVKPAESGVADNDMDFDELMEKLDKTIKENEISSKNR